MQFLRILCESVYGPTSIKVVKLTYAEVAIVSAVRVFSF